MGQNGPQYDSVTTFGDCNLEILMENFVAAQTRQSGDLIEKNLHISKTLEQLMYMVESLATRSKTLETQIIQLTCIPPGPDPEGHVNTVITRREKDTKSPKEVGKNNSEENIGIEKKIVDTT